MELSPPRSSNTRHAPIVLGDDQDDAARQLPFRYGCIAALRRVHRFFVKLSSIPSLLQEILFRRGARPSFLMIGISVSAPQAYQCKHMHGTVKARIYSPSLTH
jgi:hypothetical protein